MDNRILTIVATHKPYRMPSDPMYLPLQVGSDLHANFFTGMAQDNTGDNISQKNRYYSELTGIYWLWKNKHADYKGIVHYRRHFGSLKNKGISKDIFNNLLTSNEALDLLSHTDILLPQKRNYYIETIYSHYAHTFDAHQLDECRNIIAGTTPKYLPAWDKTMKSRAAHMFNMFIMPSKLFDEYCAWLFPILFELEKRIEPQQYDPFNARYLGRVSEVMLDPWIRTNNYTYIELPVVSPEPTNWIKKGSSFLLAKFFNKKYTASF